MNEGAAGGLAKLLTEHAKSTHDGRVSFAGEPFATLLRLDGGPTLATSTDGVGSKALVARALGAFEVLGHDAVAVNVNDLVARGARPLFFLDYLALTVPEPETVDAIGRGIARACRAAGCLFLGGETAILPDQLKDGALDVVGFAVGAVPEANLLDHDGVRVGDKVLALPSSGLHANGLSLARLAAAKSGVALTTFVESLGARLGDALLAPTEIYVDRVLGAIARGGVRRCAHVSGGGLLGRAATLVPRGLAVTIDRGRFPSPPIVDWLRDAGPIAEDELARTVNLGLGFLLVASEAAADPLVEDGFLEVGVIASGDGARWTR